MSDAQTLRQWLDGSRALYLPRWLRDHHAQKDVFKYVWRAVAADIAARRKVGKSSPVGAMSWVDAHIFVIDYFLRVMAAHGYTLQPARRRDLPYLDVDQSIAVMKAEEAAVLRGVFEKDATS